MAKLGDDLEKQVDESMPFLFEKLGDTSALINHGCLTVAQCALLIPAHLTAKMPGDASEICRDYLQLALLDIAHGELSPKHPETLLPYSQYLRMMESGMFGTDGAAMPVPDAGWLVRLDEAERWLQSRDISVNFDELKADLAKMAAAKVEAGAGATPGDEEQPRADVDHDEKLAALFDPLPVEALEKMFPAGGKWKSWADKAKANGLIIARVKTAMFNPYKAGVWFIRKGAEGWDDARLNRTLLNNLPARSRDESHLLTGGID